MRVILRESHHRPCCISCLYILAEQISTCKLLTPPADLIGMFMHRPVRSSIQKWLYNCSNACSCLVLPDAAVMLMEPFSTVSRKLVQIGLAGGPT